MICAPWEITQGCILIYFCPDKSSFKEKFVNLSNKNRNFETNRSSHAEEDGTENFAPSIIAAPN